MPDQVTFDVMRELMALIGWTLLLVVVALVFMWFIATFSDPPQTGGGSGG